MTEPDKPMEWRLTLSEPDFGAEEIAAVTRVLRSRWLTMGTVTQQFEKKFAEFCGAQHAIAVTNGTAALHLACAALGLGPGDEVIVPALTFVATANAVLYCGAMPVFADICSLEDLTISPPSMRIKITPRTRAIVVMHYAGYPCDMNAICTLARERGLFVIEDACHAVGAEYDGRKCGNLGDIGCFSFFSNKNLVTGEGGMLVTNSGELAEKIRGLRSHGMTAMTWDRHQGHAFSYEVTALGYNYRMDEIRAALGLVQLEKLPHNNQVRRELTRRYHAQLSGLPGLTLPFAGRAAHSACHLLPLILPERVDRGRFMAEMKERGIQTSIHYPALHQFDYYRRHVLRAAVSLPVAEAACRREVTLPLHARMKKDEVNLVCQTVKQSI